MKRIALKNICTFFLIAIFMHSLIPLHLPEDITRDHRVNLQDIIKMAQNLNGADDQTAEIEITDFISTAQVVAGLKTVINSYDTDTWAQFGGDLIFIKPAIPCLIKSMIHSSIFLIEVPPASMAYAPLSPPPWQPPRV